MDEPEVWPAGVWCQWLGRMRWDDARGDGASPRRLRRLLYAELCAALKVFDEADRRHILACLTVVWYARWTNSGRPQAPRRLYSREGIRTVEQLVAVVEEMDPSRVEAFRPMAEAVFRCRGVGGSTYSTTSPNGARYDLSSTNENTC
jgi:hypothetical protein